jgi:hypothetical protein
VTGGVGGNPATYNEPAERSMKRKCAALLGLSLAELCAIHDPEHLQVREGGRLGGLHSTSAEGAPTSCLGHGNG